MRIILLLFGPLVLCYFALKDPRKSWKHFTVKTLCYVCHVLPGVLLVSFATTVLLPVHTLGFVRALVLFLREIVIPLLTIYLASVWSVHRVSPFLNMDSDTDEPRQFLYLLYLFLCVYNIGRALFIQNNELVVYVGAVTPFYSIALPFIVLILLELVTPKRNLAKKQRNGAMARESRDVVQRSIYGNEITKNNQYLHRLLLLLSYGVFYIFTAMLFYQYRYILFALFTVVFLGCVTVFLKLGTLTSITRLFFHHSPSND